MIGLKGGLRSAIIKLTNMKANIKKLWLKALRSGEYQQAQGRLTNEGKFCCLGVLCDLYVKTHKSAHWDKEGEFFTGKKDNSGSPYAKRLESSTHLVPLTVRKWAGLEGDLGNLKNSIYGYDNLANLNDQVKLNFIGIAEVIQAQL